VHFDLLKRVLRDISRSGQNPEEIIDQVSATVFPMFRVRLPAYFDAVTLTRIGFAIHAPSLNILLQGPSLKWLHAACSEHQQTCGCTKLKQADLLPAGQS
jgi:hypothetical protein